MHVNEEVTARVAELCLLNKAKIGFAGPKHGVVKQIEAIIDNSKPNPEKLFIAEGIWAHDKVYANHIEVKYFVFCPEFIYSPEACNLLELYLSLCGKAFQVSAKVFEKLSERDAPDGLISVCRFPVKTLDDIELKEHNLIVVLDGIEIPGNIGTITRSADGSGTDAVVLTNRRARLVHPKVIKGSMGAGFIIPMIDADIDELFAWLDKNRFKTVLTDTAATMQYYEADYSGRVAIVAGSERYGITRGWYERPCEKISIPMFGSCDSLNVGISTTIVMYEASLQQKGMLKRRDTQT